MGSDHAEEGSVLRKQIVDFGEDKCKGSIEPYLKNLTKEMEFSNAEKTKKICIIFCTNTSLEGMPTLQPGKFVFTYF